MIIDLEDIFKELAADKEAVWLCAAVDKLKRSVAAKQKCITIAVSYTQAIAALMFEVGRLYGRQEIVNETLGEIK